ncbi:hypothetical protein [Pendulispora albinea]|uniref:Integral membrane protein n=1 Tax=Pendulispora albinea TaxID=2741071 RepID=A0ABZ2LX09_9BACT
MSSSVFFATMSSGVFLLVGLISGVWKFRAIMASAEHRAPTYVDIAHRASLMYSFAALVLGKLAESSALPEAVNVGAVAVPVFFFAVAIGTYIRLGFTRETDNQYERRTFTTTTGTWLLAIGELAGVVVLLVGFVLGRLQ